MNNLKIIIILAIIFLNCFNNSFALTPKSKQIYAGLKQLVEIFYPEDAEMQRNNNVPDEWYVFVSDYCCNPDSSDWTRKQYKDFNLKFGVYYIDRAYVYMLIHQGSIYIYKSDNSDVRPKLMKHIISIMKAEPDLVSSNVFFNITENLFFRFRNCRFSFINYEDEYIDFGPFNLYLDSERLITIFEERAK